MAANVPTGEFWERAWDTLLWVERDPEADGDMHIGLCESLRSALLYLESVSPENKALSDAAYIKADEANPDPELQDDDEVTS